MVGREVGPQAPNVVCALGLVREDGKHWTRGSVNTRVERRDCHFSITARRVESPATNTHGIAYVLDFTAGSLIRRSRVQIK